MADSHVVALAKIYRALDAVETMTAPREVIVTLNTTLVDAAGLHIPHCTPAELSTLAQASRIARGF